MAADVGKGYILFEYFYDIGSGGAVADLTGHAKFPDQPDESEWLTSFFAPEGVTGGGGIRDNYGIRGRAYVYPPQTGDYTFWVAGDDYCELWLSTDEDPANATMIAEVPGWTPAQDWLNTGGGSSDADAQESDPIPLVAGQRYYIEALMKEAGGGESVGVAWGGPGIGAGPILLDGKYCAAVIRDPEPMLSATNPTPADGAIGVSSPLLMWDASTVAQWHDVYLGTDPEPAFVGRQMFNLYYLVTGLEPGATYYWKVDEVEADGTTVHEGSVWSFTAASLTAWSPEPGNGVQYVPAGSVLKWKAGMNASGHDVYLSTDADAVANRDASVRVADQLPALSYDPGGLENDTTYYWVVDERGMGGTKQEGEVWSFRTLPVINIDDPSLIGWWKLNEGLGTFAVDWSGHGNHGEIRGDAQWVEGLFGDALNFDGVDNFVFTDKSAADLDVDADKPKTATAWVYTRGFNNGAIFDLGARSAGQDFCLRTLGTVDNWRTQHWDAAYDHDFVQASADDWVHFALVFNGTDSTVYANGVSVSSKACVLNTATANPFQIGCYGWPEYYFDGVIQDVRLYNKALTADEIKVVMRGDPSLAWDPQPGHGADVDIRNATTLAWQAGDGAIQHDVYFGADRDAVRLADETAAEYLGRQNATSYPLAGLVEFGGGSYYWRIDEVKADGTIARGGVWRFTVPDFLIVDNFEQYTNDADNLERVFQTWIDGWGYSEPPPGKLGNGTGATGGHDIWSPDSPYYQGQIMETTDVHGGNQAMPGYFDNSAMPYKSEFERTWVTPQDLTVAGVTDLSLWFKGSPAAFIDNGGGSFTMSASGADIWTTADQFRFAYKSLSGNGSITAKVESVENTNTWAKAGVMIREGLAAGAKHVMVVVTPGQGIQFTWRDFTNADMTEHNTQTGLAAPYWVRLTRTGNTFTAELSADGTNWQPLVDAASNTHDLAVIGNVYIGLCLTSHDAAAVTVAEFSNVSTSGGVSGAWQIEEVGFDHPDNGLADVYVRLEDSMGRSDTEVYPGGTVVNQWTEWKIALTEFAGVSTNAIKKMTLGIGNPDAPMADGSGMVFLDDIRVVGPAPPDDGS
jgi:regulation of enolase protein 1 (concanavalin A-like superfamily)